MEWLGEMPHIGRLARLPYLEMMRTVYGILHSRGHGEVHSHHSIVFQCIGKGARMADMARRANMTKQNMKYLLDQLEAAGYVSRKADREDGRAFIYSLTRKGVAFRDLAYKVIGEVELAWAARMGIENMLTLKRLLLQLNHLLEENDAGQHPTKNPDITAGISAPPPGLEPGTYPDKFAGNLSGPL